MSVDSYLELFTTLFGWAFYNVLWDVLVGTGIVYLPFLGILIDNWREPAQGGEFGTVTGLSLRRMELDLFLALLVVVGVLLVYITVKPLGAETLAAQPDPTAGREEALARWATVEARDDETIDERCRSWSLLHEEPVETTVVLLHGYTNCPYMFRRLGADLHAIGWNVLAPRSPYHGYVDKLSTDQGLLTARDTVVDLIGSADDNTLSFSLGYDYDLWAVGIGVRYMLGSKSE